MNETENLILQGIQLGIDRLALEIAKQRQEAQSRGQYAGLPEWIDLEQAVTLKRGICVEKKRAENGKRREAGAAIVGGASLNHYRQKLFLQPCCGRNYKMVGGRRCWKREDVIAWLGITDEGLKGYAEKNSAELPEIYLKRAAE
jgi:hypothetical protein